MQRESKRPAMETKKLTPPITHVSVAREADVHKSCRMMCLVACIDRKSNVAPCRGMSLPPAFDIREGLISPVFTCKV
jgi:hypothetical protein